MSFVNANGRSRAAFGLLPDEGVNLTFTDAAGVPRTVLGVSPGDAAQLIFAGGNGVPRITLGLDEMGIAHLTLPETPEDSLSEETGRGQGGL